MKKLLTLLLAIVFSSHAFSQITLGSGSTSQGPLPYDVLNAYTFSEQIFLKSEINAASAGQISGVKFYLPTYGDVSHSDLLDVWIGHSTKQSFSSTTDWVPVANLTKVFSDSIVNKNGVVEVVFTQPFTYNNTDNLVIAINEKRPSYDNANYRFYNYTGSPNTALYRGSFSATTPYNPDSPGYGTRAANKSVITLTGLTKSSVPVIPICPQMTMPENNSRDIPLDTSISWGVVNDATSYKITIGTTANGSDVVNGQTVNGTTYKPTSPLLAGTKYYVKITALNSAGESVGCTYSSFTTKFNKPANDDCGTATPIAAFPYQFNQADGGGATQTAVVSICNPNGDMNDGVWYSFDGNGGIVKIVVAPVSWNAAVGIYSGSCGALQCEIVKDDNGLGGTETVTLETTLGKKYFINIGHWDTTGDSPEGAFTINVTTDLLGVNEISAAAKYLASNQISTELQFLNADKLSAFEIYDASGKRAMAGNVKSSTVNVSSLPKGIYILKLTAKDGKVTTGKLIKH